MAFDQDVGATRRRQTKVRRGAQRLRDADLAQLGRLGGVTQHEILRDEFDVEQPTFGELQIPGIGVALFLRDQGAHLAHVLGDIAFRAGDRLDDGGLDVTGEACVAGDDAGARQRHLLPGLGLVGLVGAEGGKLRRHRPLVARRAQAHVDVVELAGARRRGQGGDEPLRQTGEILHRMELARAVRVRRRRVEIIDQHEVEIGRRRHLARAELAQRDDDGARPRHAAVLDGELLAHRVKRRGEDRFGEHAVGERALLRLDPGREHARADQEHFVLRQIARLIEEGFKIGD